MIEYSYVETWIGYYRGFKIEISRRNKIKSLTILIEPQFGGIPHLFRCKGLAESKRFAKRFIDGLK